MVKEIINGKKQMEKLERMTIEGAPFQEIKEEFDNCMKKIGAHNPLIEGYVTNYKILRVQN